jgi:putative sterol carrier protein
VILGGIEMTYEELVKLAKKTYEKADASAVKEHVAIQFNVTGEAEGAFYLEVKDGKVSVEPYEYYDRDVIVTAEDTVLAQIANGKLGLEAAYLSGKIKAEGNLKKALLLKELKEAAKKAPAKKEAAPKKEAAKKAPAKKAPAKKAPAKKEENK